MEKQKPRPKIGQTVKPPSLCWQCGNACDGGCSWSESLTPVEGWVAEEQPKISYFDGKPGYRVIECPEYTPEAHREWRTTDLDNEGCVRLVAAVLAACRDDYIHSTPDDLTRNQIERFLRGRGAYRLHGIENPEMVIEMLKKDALEYKKRMAQLSIVK